MNKTLIIGDTHYIESRAKAIAVAESSILSICKGQTFKDIIFLGDLFDRKPSAKERLMLASFINSLRKHTKHFSFIQGNGRHEFESDTIHEADWMALCPDFSQHEEIAIENYIFAHCEVKGTRYVNGCLSASERNVDKTKTYILGHIHSPNCSFNNVNYVGSIYKTAFDQITDEKRIAIIDEQGLRFFPIESRPMFQVELYGSKTVVKSKGLKQLQELKITDIDLKIMVETDSLSLSSIHRAIEKIKSQFNIEYYKQLVNIKELPVDVPKNLNQDELLKKYCELKGVSHELVRSALNHGKA